MPSPPFRAIASRPGVAFALAMLAVIAIGWVDLITGPEFGLSLFLAVPVFMAADRAGPALGAIVAAAGVAAWVAAHVLAVPAVERAEIVVWNACVRAAFFGVLVALARMRRRFLKEHVAASTDPLTSMPNRRALNDVFVRERARALRSKRPLTIAYIDCDDFKAINDRFGHATGNELLRTVAATLASSVRAVDLAARIGGDEFAVILVDADANHAREVLDRVQAALRAAMARRGWSVTFSIGALTSAEPPDTAEDALAAADRLMYRAKETGKDALIHESVSRSQG